MNLGYSQYLYLISRKHSHTKITKSLIYLQCHLRHSHDILLMSNILLYGWLHGLLLLRTFLLIDVTFPQKILIGN